MYRMIRDNLKVILAVCITAMIMGGAPAIADGVRHALFAHNAGKIDGIDSPALQKKCQNGSVLAFARIDISAATTGDLSTNGVDEAYNCKSPRNPALVAKGSDGQSYVHFPGLMTGYAYDQAHYVVTGNVEGLIHNISFARNGYGDPTVPVINAATYRIDTDQLTHVSYTVTLLKVAR